MSATATFRVGVRIPPVKGGGRLTIAPGSIVLETDRLTQLLSGVSRIVHTDSEVTLVKARLVPPWFNTSLVLHDDKSSGQAATWQGARPRLSASLRAAGFEVHEVVTWLSLSGAVNTARQRNRGSWALSSRGRASLAVMAMVGAAVAVLLVSRYPAFVVFAVACLALLLMPLLRR